MSQCHPRGSPDEIVRTARLRHHAHVQSRRCRMTRLQPRATAFALLLTVTSVPAVAQIMPEAQSTVPPRSGAAFPQPGADDPIANEGIVEDGAVQALKDMSAFLMSANTLGITSQGSLDVVTND